MSLHYISLSYIRLGYISLNYIRLGYISLSYIRLVITVFKTMW